MVTAGLHVTIPFNKGAAAPSVHTLGKRRGEGTNRRSIVIWHKPVAWSGLALLFRILNRRPSGDAKRVTTGCQPTTRFSRGEDVGDVPVSRLEPPSTSTNWPRAEVMTG